MMKDLRFDLKQYPTSIRTKFKKFHALHPNIYQHFKAKVFEIKASGKKKYSARTIFESIRWDYDLQGHNKLFKINGDFIPIYSRLLVHYHPELKTFFEFRSIRSKGIGSFEENHRALGA